MRGSIIAAPSRPWSSTSPPRKSVTRSVHLGAVVVGQTDDGPRRDRDASWRTTAPFGPWKNSVFAVFGSMTAPSWWMCVHIPRTRPIRRCRRRRSSRPSPGGCFPVCLRVGVPARFGCQGVPSGAVFSTSIRRRVWLPHPVRRSIAASSPTSRPQHRPEPRQRVVEFRHVDRDRDAVGHFASLFAPPTLTASCIITAPASARVKRHGCGASISIFVGGGVGIDRRLTARACRKGQGGLAGGDGFETLDCRFVALLDPLVGAREGQGDAVERNVDRVDLQRLAAVGVEARKLIGRIAAFQNRADLRAGVADRRLNSPVVADAGLSRRPRA